MTCICLLRAENNKVLRTDMVSLIDFVSPYKKKKYIYIPFKFQKEKRKVQIYTGFILYQCRNFSALEEYGHVRLEGSKFRVTWHFH